MRLDISEVALTVGKRSHYDINEPPIDDLSDGLKNVAGIKGELNFSNSGSAVIIRGQFKTAVELECSRCVSIYRMDLDLPIEEEFPLPGHMPTGSEVPYEELPEDEKEPLFVENILDLTELLRQTMLVAIPIKPLCSEACRGLCPRCGKNLTEGPCQCPPDNINPALADLASLLKKDEKEE